MTALEQLLAWQAAAPWRSIQIDHRPVLPEGLGEFFVSALERRADGSWSQYGQVFAESVEAAARMALEQLEPWVTLADGRQCPASSAQWMPVAEVTP